MLPNFSSTFWDPLYLKKKLKIFDIAKVEKYFENRHFFTGIAPVRLFIQHMRSSYPFLSLVFTLWLLTAQPQFFFLEGTFITLFFLSANLSQTMRSTYRYRYNNAVYDIASWGLMYLPFFSSQTCPCR